MSGVTTTASETQAAKSRLRRDLFFIAYAAFITTMAQPQVLGTLPIRFLLMETFEATPLELSTFLFWAGLAWYLKPIFGLVIDAFPLWGTRRRWYMIVSTILAALAWLLVSYMTRFCSAHHFGPFLAAAIILGALMVVASTIMGALLVEVGQRYQATGRVSAVREVVTNGCLILTGPIGGKLAEIEFGWTAGIGTGLLLSLAVAAYLFLPEKATARRDIQVFAKAWTQLRLVLGSGTLWAAAGLLVLFFFSPGFTTPLLYRQKNLMHFDKEFLGILGMVDGIFMVFGAVFYALICRWMHLRTLLFAGIFFYGVAALLYLGYHPDRQGTFLIETVNHLLPRDIPLRLAPYVGAILIEAVAQFLQAVGVLPLYDLATRATPRGGEAMGYALMMSARNLAIFGADVVGSWLLETNFGGGLVGSWVLQNFSIWNALVWLNAGTTFVCLIAIPFLPGILMRHRDGENLGEPGATGEQISGPEPAPRAP